MLVANYPLTTNISSTVGEDEDNIRLAAHFDRPEKTYYEGTFNNSITTKYFAIASCLPADMSGEYSGIYTGDKWEVQLELKAPNYSDNSEIIVIDNDNSSDPTFTVTTNSSNTDSTAIYINPNELMDWKKIIIKNDGSTISLYLNSVLEGQSGGVFKFPYKRTRTGWVGAFWHLDSKIIVGNLENEFSIRNVKLYVDEVTTEGIDAPSEDITPPSPPSILPTNPTINLIANYPLTANGNNSVTNIDATKDMNVVGNFTGDFSKGYFSGNTATISLNRPYVDNYTNAYTGMPWEINFQIYIPDCKDNITILTVSNPSSNANKNRTMTLTTNANPSTPYEICVPIEVFNEGWVDCKVQCTGTGGELNFYANGQQYGNTVRGFILTSDLGTNPSVITFVNNGITINLANVIIFMDSTTETVREYTEYWMDLKFTVKKAVLISTPLLVDIPFPYPQFTEMEFFLTDMFGNYIPSSYYERLDENRLWFPSSSVTSLNLSDADEIRFTFVHNRGMYAINKLEYTTKTKDGIFEYKLPSPFNQLMDLNMRYRVFYDHKLLFGDTMYEYTINKYTGMIIFDNEDFKLEGDKDLTVLMFYTGTKYNTAVPTLPMSGYVYFKKHEIDRNYNKDLCCFFLNGRLVHRDNIIKMSNNIYKISKDLKSRYNIEAFSMSPKIDELIPFYKKAGRKNTIPQQYIYKEMEIMFYVPRDNATTEPHGRKILEPLTANILTVPHHVLPNHDNWYITLIHHGVDEGEFFDERSLSYNIEFYRDDYSTQPEPVNIIGQIRLQGNFEPDIPNSPTAMLIGTIPQEISTCISDTVLCTVQAKTIYDADTYNHGKDIDGVLVRLEIEPFDKKHERPRIYYEMEATEYEKDNYVNVFEWIVSEEANGQGQEYYRKVINMFPDNNPYENR